MNEFFGHHYSIVQFLLVFGLHDAGKIALLYSLLKFELRIFSQKLLLGIFNIYVSQGLDEIWIIDLAISKNIIRFEHGLEIDFLEIRSFLFHFLKNIDHLFLHLIRPGFD